VKCLELNYLALFDALPNPYVVLDRRLYIVGANQAFLASTKRTLDDIVGRWAWDAFPTDPETLKQSIASFERVIDTKKPDTMALLRFDVPRPEAEGGGFEKRYWSITHTPILNEAGEVEVVLQNPIDVTELERLRDATGGTETGDTLNLAPAQTGIFDRAQAVSEANLALKAERDRNHQLLENMDQGYVYMDAEFRVLEMNRYALRMEDRPASEILGKIHWDAWPGTKNLPIGQAYKRAMKERVPVDIEQPHVFPDGRSAWMDVHVYPTGDGIAVFYRDISRKKRAEHALKETAERLEFTLESAQIGEWYLDLLSDTSHHSLRHDQCFGYREPIADWGFGKLIDHIHPEDREFVRQQFHDAIGKLAHCHFDCKVVWPDQSVHWIAMHASVYHVQSTPATMSGIVYDITERKEAEVELRKEAQRKDEFLAMLAHELRNPLAPIAAAAGLLKMGQLDEKRRQQTSDVIHRQISHMTSLIDDLLDVSRVTRGLAQLSMGELEAKTIIADAIEQVRPLIESYAHHLEVHLAPETAFLMGDHKRLVQIFTNLLNNAAKYTPRGGRIQLIMEVDEHQIRFLVCDNGIGMSPDLVTRVFDLFAQGKRTSDRSQGGLGIGLALVKSLVELHGGNVSAHSAGLGAGSKFTVCLPRVIQHYVQNHSPNPASHRQATSQGLRVLVVDDNVDAADMLGMFLESAGHEIAIENDAPSALKRAAVFCPEVCLLDLGLPGMDGNELARQLRNLPQTAKAVLIALTGYGQQQDKDNSFKSGFDYHFVKPMDAGQLRKLLTELGETK
jgi:PAS domain S-box-containing protein